MFLEDHFGSEMGNPVLGFFYSANKYQFGMWVYIQWKQEEPLRGH